MKNSMAVPRSRCHTRITIDSSHIKRTGPTRRRDRPADSSFRRPPGQVLLGEIARHKGDQDHFHDLGGLKVEGAHAQPKARGKVQAGGVPPQHDCRPEQQQSRRQQTVSIAAQPAQDLRKYRDAKHSQNADRQPQRLTVGKGGRQPFDRHQAPAAEEHRQGQQQRVVARQPPMQYMRGAQRAKNPNGEARPLVGARRTRSRNQRHAGEYECACQQEQQPDIALPARAKDCPRNRPGTIEIRPSQG